MAATKLFAAVIPLVGLLVIVVAIVWANAQFTFGMSDAMQTSLRIAGVAWFAATLWTARRLISRKAGNA